MNGAAGFSLDISDAIEPFAVSSPIERYVQADDVDACFSIRRSSQAKRKDGTRISGDFPGQASHVGNKSSRRVNIDLMRLET